jgi:hypothetical protein
MCDRPDWIIWLAHKTGTPTRVLVEAAWRCATAVQPPTTDPDVAAALALVRRWLDGEGVTLGQLREAAVAAAWVAAAWVGDRKSVV